MQRSVDLNGDARAHYCKVGDVAPNRMLPANGDAFVAQQAQPRPGVAFGPRCFSPKNVCELACHASFGCFSARRMSQAPSSIIGIESSMPMVI